MSRVPPLDRDWLAREMREATSDLALSFSPSPALGLALAGTMVPPLPPYDARRLREKMAIRYRDWTGRDLATDLAEDARADPLASPLSRK